MRRAANRLPGWQAAALATSGGLTLASGAIWLALHYRSGAAPELPHPAEAWLMRLHGLAAFGALFVLGALAAAHIPQGWRLVARRGWTGQRRSGFYLCALAGLLVATGYALYYFAPEPVRPALGWVHAALGLATGVLLLRHRRHRRESHRHPGE